MDPVLMKVADKCFEEFKNTSIYFCVSQLLSVIHLEKDSNSLKMLALKAAFKEALECKNTLNEVESILMEESLLLSNLHFFDHNPVLLRAILQSFNKNKNNSFSLKVGNSECQLQLNRNTILEFNNVETDKWIDDYMTILIQSGVKKFSVLVTESNDPNETPEQKLRRILETIDGEAVCLKIYEHVECNLKCFNRMIFNLQSGSAAVMTKVAFGCN